MFNFLNKNIFIKAITVIVMGCFYSFLMFGIFVSCKEFGYSCAPKMDAGGLAFLSVYGGFSLSVALHIYDI
ncbi:hypothetical protein JF634_06210 [Simonsiella muelleri]|uniref:Uncharacterized protein n=1 Tax=Simonsiella muelleri ATCC 29453 TaxID=641147 RepID=V9HLR6_9NEIS|nr:hypothetical protein [Simonsiella muelleri]AUX62333.1 hypothetical protein BWP33_11340 [Simonsiella muelleri ATCC 29453]EFG30580.1 hypothetical protein HMPREF9021_01549 [Simonsiella muelleri ATCC 29453]UBQ52831.1 hypothetical protein JF634_06210 [Simonsiella muelleri]